MQLDYVYLARLSGDPAVGDAVRKQLFTDMIGWLINGFPINLIIRGLLVIDHVKLWGNYRTVDELIILMTELFYCISLSKLQIPSSPFILLLCFVWHTLTNSMSLSK